jgi:hypothetical protein
MTGKPSSQTTIGRTGINFNYEELFFLFIQWIRLACCRALDYFIGNRGLFEGAGRYAGAVPA